MLLIISHSAASTLFTYTSNKDMFKKDFLSEMVSFVISSSVSFKHLARFNFVLKSDLGRNLLHSTQSQMGFAQEVKLFKCQALKARPTNSYF